MHSPASHPIPRAAWVSLAGIALSYILTALSLSGMNVALPSIAREFPASAVLLGWVPTAFLLANAILVLPSGRLAERIGPKRVYLAGLFIFGVSHYLVTLAADIYWIIALRAVQALGAAMAQACGMAILHTLFPADRRGLVIGICASSIYFGLAAGPFVAGLLTHAFGWRSVFYFQLPLVLLLIWLLRPRLPHADGSGERRPFDWPGFALLGVALTAIMTGISLLPGLHSLPIVGLGLLLAAAFCRHQWHAEHPLLHLRAIAGNRPFRDALVVILAMYAAAFPLMFTLSLYLQFVRGMSASQAGAMLVVQAVVMSLTAPLAGRFSDRLPPVRLAAAGSGFAALGYGVLCWLERDTHMLQVALGLALVGLGMGLFSSPNQNAAYSAVRPERLAMATAVLNLSRNVGNMIGMGAALGLIALLVGPDDITPANHDAFLLAARLMFLFSLLAVLLAVAVGVKRWRNA